MEPAPKMNWIYEGVSGLVDKEEYLTGRKIDKTFEIAQFEKDGGNVCDFSFQENNIPSLLESSTSNLSKLDLDLRLKEDPLHEIKRTQANIIKETLTNPIKMRRIKQLLEESLRKEKEEKRERKKLKKLRKKAKKLKKERKRSVSGSSSGSVDGARDQHKRRAEDARELPKRIKRERREFSGESSGGSQADKLDSRKHENEPTSKTRFSSTAGKRGDFGKASSNERVQMKQERRSVNRDRSASASRKHRGSRKRSESSELCSSGSSVNYSSSASSRSSSVSSSRYGKHRSRSQSIVRNSRNRRRSSPRGEFKVKRRSDTNRIDRHSSDHRSSRDRKSEKYYEHKSTKDRHGDRHAAKFDDRYRDHQDKPRERSRKTSSANMEVDEWPEDERDMIPVIQSPRSIDPLKFAKPLRKERQEQKNRRLFESGQHEGSLVADNLISSRYNTNFNQNHPKYNNYDPNDEYRLSKRKKSDCKDSEQEMEAKRKQMMANAEWREAQRSKDVEMHVREYEQEAAEIQNNLNRKYSARYH